jgi:hypothetical protein
MATFTGSDDLQGAEFIGANLRGVRFVESDLTGMIMRGVEVAQADIDAPWLVHGGSFLVNGVDVIAFVEAELDRRFPGRAERRAGDPESLRAAWAAVERTWAGTLERAAAMPPGTVDVQVSGEWSFAQTLRHLVHATDLWFRKAIVGVEQPFHPLGLAYEPAGGAEASDPPPYDEVLEAWAGRVAMVRDFIARVTPEQLAEERQNPHDPRHPETVLSCLHTILEEQWEHHRFAVRDLDAIAAERGA